MLASALLTRLALARPRALTSLAPMRIRTVLLAFLFCAAAAPRASADAGPLAEVRLGLLWPDIGPAADRLPGADVNAELRFTLPLAGWTANLPAWLRWAATPGLQVGGTANTAVTARTGYAGLTWSVPLASSLLHADDALSFGFSIGPGFLGGAGAPHGLTAGPQLRLGAEIGYQVTPRFGLYVLFDHVSSGALTHETESLNELGVRVGLHF